MYPALSTSVNTPEEIFTGIWWLRPATDIKTDIKFDGGLEPWLIPATKSKSKTKINFDGGFGTCLIFATKIRTKTSVQFDCGFEPPKLNQYQI